MLSQPELTVVIVTWNSNRWMTACLESLSTDINELSHHIVVVDNASTDQTADLIQNQFPDVTMLKNSQNEGFARACNRALAQCNSEYVLLLNPDTKVLPGMARALMTFMKTHPEAGAIGPTILNTDGSFQLSGNTFPNLKNLWIEAFFLDRVFAANATFGSHQLSHVDRSQPFKVDWTMGSCLLARKKTLDDVRGLDEHFFLFFEETDLCLRIKQAGYEIYIVPEAKIVHSGGAYRPENYSAHKIVHYHRSLFHFSDRHWTIHPFWVRLVMLMRSLIRIAMWILLYPVYFRTAPEKLRGYKQVLKLCLKIK